MEQSLCFYICRSMTLYVTVKPNRRADKVEKVGNNWVIHLSAPATDGKANQRLVEFMSELLDIPPSAIMIMKGYTSKLKCLNIPGENDVVISKLNAAIQNESSR